MSSPTTAAANPMALAAPAERLRQQLAEAPDRIAFVFARLSLRYGQRLAAMYEGLLEELVMEDWRDQLDGYTDEALLWGLAHLPDDFPPNAGQFRRLCNSRPSTTGQRQRRLGLEVAPMPKAARELQRQFQVGRPDDDGAPQKVRAARYCIARLTAPGAAPSPLEREFLANAREIVRRWEGEKTTEQLALAQKKAEAAAAVQQYQAEAGEPQA